jgi:ABC-type methionine transport system permease subunit
MQVYHAQHIPATTIKETNLLASACVPIMDESRQLLVSTMFMVISSMLVATLCTRPAGKLLLVTRVQHVHAPARHNVWWRKWKLLQSPFMLCFIPR